MTTILRTVVLGAILVFLPGVFSGQVRVRQREPISNNEQHPKPLHVEEKRSVDVQSLQYQIHRLRQEKLGNPDANVDEQIWALQCQILQNTDDRPNGEGPKSEGPGSVSYLRFVNQSPTNVNVFWLNYEGDQVKYHTLSPEQAALTLSYVGHPWVFRDATTDETLLGNDEEVYCPVAADEANPIVVHITVPESGTGLNTRDTIIIAVIVPLVGISLVSIIIRQKMRRQQRVNNRQPGHVITTNVPDQTTTQCTTNMAQHTNTTFTPNAYEPHSYNHSNQPTSTNPNVHPTPSAPMGPGMNWETQYQNWETPAGPAPTDAPPAYESLFSEKSKM